MAGTRDELRTKAKELGLHDYNADYAMISERLDIELTSNRETFAERLKALAECDTNFLSFKNDENFLKHYDEGMSELTSYAALAPLLLDLKQEDIDRFNQDYGLELPSLQSLQDKANGYTYMRDWMGAKLDQMKNANYGKEADYADKSTEELEERRLEANRAGDKELEAYINSHQRMQKAESLGATHIDDGKYKAMSWGNSGRTHHKWGVEIGSFKGGFKVPAYDVFKNPKKRAEFFKSLDANTKLTILERARLTEKDVSEGKTQKLKPIEVEDLYKSVVEVNKDLVSTDAKAKIAKGTYKYKNGGFSFGANLSVGAVGGKGKIGAGLSAGKKWEAKLSASVDASATAIQGRVKIGYKGDNAGVEAKISGKVGTAKASAFAGVGRMNIIGEDGKKKEVVGVAGTLSAQAAAAEAEGGVKFTLFGVKIGLTATVQAGGVGGTIGGFVNSGGIGASFGALLGVGFKLGFSIDWSGVGKWWKERKNRQKLKKAQREEMKARAKEEKAAKEAKKKGVKKTSFKELKEKLSENKEENHVQRSLTNRVSSPVKRSGSEINDHRANSLG